MKLRRIGEVVETKATEIRQSPVSLLFLLIEVLALFVFPPILVGMAWGFVVSLVFVLITAILMFGVTSGRLEHKPWDKVLIVSFVGMYAISVGAVLIVSNVFVMIAYLLITVPSLFLASELNFH